VSRETFEFVTEALTAAHELETFDSGEAEADRRGDLGPRPSDGP